MSGDGNTYSATGGGIYEPPVRNAYEPDMLDKNWGDEAAAENQADLARAEYDDYKRRFVPIENELINQIGNRGLYAENANRASSAVADAYAGTAGEYQRGLSRYGVTQTGEEQANQSRQMGLSMAANTAEAVNRSRANTKNRSTQVLAGGIAPTREDIGG